MVVAAAVWQAPNADWDLALFGILLGFSIFSDVMSIETESHLKISGNFLALVLAMVFLGGTPAALIGADLDPRRLAPLPRRPARPARSTSLTYIAFPLVVGVAFHEIVDERRDHLRPNSPSTSSSSAPSSPRWR